MSRSGFLFVTHASCGFLEVVGCGAVDILVSCVVDSVLLLVGRHDDLCSSGFTGERKARIL